MSTVDKRREPCQINALIADVKDLARIVPRAAWRALHPLARPQQPRSDL